MVSDYMQKVGGENLMPGERWYGLADSSGEVDFEWETSWVRTAPLCW